jgi:isopenicillin N synthase-like dioxygenase
MGYSDWTEDKIEEDYVAGDIVEGDFDTIPVLDISGMFSEDIETRKKVAAELREACTTVGFFYMENHGIPKELIDKQFEMGKAFFDLPFEKKMEVYIDNTPHYRGFTPLQGSGKPGPDGKGSMVPWITFSAYH